MMRPTLCVAIVCCACLPGQSRTEGREAKEHRRIVLGVAMLRAELYARAVLDKGDPSVEALLAASLPLLGAGELGKGATDNLLAEVLDELPEVTPLRDVGTAAERAVRKRLEQPIGPYEFREATLNDWVFRFANGSRAAISYLVPQHLEPGHGTIRGFFLPEMPAIDAIAVMCTATGLEFSLRNNVLRLQAARAPAVNADEPAERTAARLAEIRRATGEIANVLGMLGERAEPAVPALRALTAHDDPQLAARAKAALRQLAR